MCTRRFKHSRVGPHGQTSTAGMVDAAILPTEALLPEVTIDDARESP
jgi:hypothetical protein